MISRRAFDWSKLGWTLLLVPLMLLAARSYAGTDPPITLPLLLDGQALTTMTLYDGAAGRYVKVAEIVPVLKDLVSVQNQPEVMQGMNLGSAWFLDEPRGGLGLSYDAGSVALVLTLPPKMRRPQALAMQHGASLPAGKMVLPAAVSGYVNMYAADTHQTNMGMSSGRQPARLDMDGALNVHGWVAEGQATYSEQVSGTGGLKMQNRRLVHDDTASMLRYQAGELSYPTAGLQRYRNLVGAGVARNFDLQPYRVTRPSGRAEFILETPSTVDVYVNGNRLQTLQLAAGTYSLSDFPVVNGANDLKLVITDAAGRRVTQSFPVVSDGDMLGQGLSSFAASAGVPKQGTKDGDGAVFSGLMRYGVRDDLTAGANLQGDAWQQVVGAEASMAGEFGMVHGDVALSHDAWRDDIFAGALRLDYRNVVGQQGRDSWQASAEYRGAYFNLPEQGDPNAFALSLSASYTKSLTAALSLTVGSQYRAGRGDTDDDMRLTSNLLWRVDKAWSLNLDTILARNEGLSLLAGLTWTPTFANTLTASLDTQRSTTRLDWLQRPVNSQLGLDTDVALERHVDSDKSDYALAGTATYTGERGQVRLRQDASTSGLDRHSQPANATTTQLSLASAVVYADGTWGVSRPVANSFAIVDGGYAQVGVNPKVEAGPEMSADGEEGEVGGETERFEASSGWLGPAVLPDLSPYLFRPVNVDVTAKTGPAGALAALGAGHEQMVLLPAYKSGTRLHIALEPRTIVRGILLDAQGNPLALQAGEVRHIHDDDDPKKVAVEAADYADVEPAGGSDPVSGRHMIFTNREGRFTINGLHNGHYELTLARAGEVIPFDVAETPTGEIDLGKLQVEMLANRERSELRLERTEGSGMCGGC